MRTHLTRTFAALMVSALCGMASAQIEGPEWVEQADAGSTPGTAQPVTGNGQLQRISGTLAGPSNLAGLGDFEDMYLIHILVPTAFSIRTDPDSIGGMANFDTQLWVFDASGFGILGNQDAHAKTTGSAIFQFSDDGTEAGIFEPGDYLVCISGAGNTPHSTPPPKEGGPTPNPNQIYMFNKPFEVSGPDGAGGFSPVTGWEPSGAVGTYTIALTGTQFLIPAPGALPLLVLGIARRRRRRG